MLFSSGGQNLGNGFFVGVGGANGNELNEQQVMAVGGTFTALNCFMSKTATVNLTFTLRKNGTSTALTCVILSGQLLGSGTGSVSFAAGDLIDIGCPATNVPGTPGSFALVVGP
jgi:hypothetical protein